MDSNDIEAAYMDIIFGYNEPEAIWGSGVAILYMRAKIGITDVNDSNGDPIIIDRCYCVTKGGRTVPVGQDSFGTNG